MVSAGGPWVFPVRVLVRRVVVVVVMVAMHWDLQFRSVVHLHPPPVQARLRMMPARMRLVQPVALLRPLRLLQVRLVQLLRKNNVQRRYDTAHHLLPEHRAKIDKLIAKHDKRGDGNFTTEEVVAILEDKMITDYIGADDKAAAKSLAGSLTKSTQQNSRLKKLFSLGAAVLAVACCIVLAEVFAVY